MNFRWANRLLLAGIIIINLYVIGLPLFSLAGFWWQKHVSHQPQKLAQLVRSLPPKNGPAANQLIIPSIALDYKILEGPNAHTVDKGIWHYPKSGLPGQAGNTVLIGHRFTYNGADALMHLDLVKLKDSITIIWNGQKITYTVSDIKVVKPNDTSIIQPSNNKRLTIYTCTPMWTNKMRLVVIAQQEQT
jgi:LPXTG-site transpeptidase (sortase) family protein